MLVSFQDKKGDVNRTVHTHTSLVEDEVAEKVHAVYRNETGFKRGACFLTFYGMMEAVNRIPKLSSLRLEYRVAAVALPVLLMRSLASSLYWRTGATDSVKQLLNGAPVWTNKFEVPDLRNMYFTLDDDNNYEPSLLHHGV